MTDRACNCPKGSPFHWHEPDFVQACDWSDFRKAASLRQNQTEAIERARQQGKNPTVSLVMRASSKKALAQRTIAASLTTDHLFKPKKKRA